MRAKSSKQRCPALCLAECSLNNLRSYTLLIRYLNVHSPESGSLETGLQGSESDGSAR